MGEFLGTLFLATFFFICCSDYGNCACTERKSLLNKESLSSKLITDFSLWSKSGVESSADCATYCGRDSHCVSFFYNPETGVCTGHTLQFYSTEPSIEQKGSLYYPMAVDKTDCADIQMNDPDSPDGVYIINPLDGRGPFRVFCDMTTEGGGWTSGVESSADCATYCGRDTQCVSFFYNPETGVCTGHTLQFYSTEPSIEQKGSLYYSMAVDKTDCADIQMNDPDSPDGVYIINPLDGRGPFRVFCDMTTDGGGWTVFLRREDGSEDFNRGWNDFKKGFSNPASEFWLGNDAINRLTAAKPSELRVDMEDWENQSGYATYNEFIVWDEASNYLLTVTGYNGTVGDSFSHHNGMRFTTKDRDNDVKAYQNCASTYPGGWWFKMCHETHLTGIYGDTSTAMGVIWYKWHGHNYSLKKAEMKMRPT